MSRCGRLREVSELAIADRIYNEWTDSEDEVVDILRRKVEVSALGPSGLQPVCVPKGALSNGYPWVRTLFSPQQMVATVRRAKPNRRYREFTLKPASEISGSFISPAMQTVEYHCVFFERQRYLRVNGLLTLAYSGEDLCHA